MRGDSPKRQNSYIVADVTDKDGKVQYNIIPARWVQISLVLFGALIIIAVLLGLMAGFNRIDLENLRYRMEIKENANTSNINR